MLFETNYSKQMLFVAHNFEYKGKNIILSIYKSLIRPRFAYAVQFWSLHLIKDIPKIKSVQRRATKLMSSLHKKFYEVRLPNLGLPSLEIRRLICHLSIL